MDKIICLVGESGSGKTTLCKELKKQGYNIIKSYTTRKTRSKDEYGHIFITRDEIMKNRGIQYNPNICNLDMAIQFSIGTDENTIAYTYFDNEHYYATKGQYQGKGSSIYVIDPAGVKYLRKKITDTEILTIYIKCDKEVRLLRMLKERETESVKDRLINDKEAFRIIQCDYCVDGNREINEVLKDVIHIIESE